MVVHSRAEPGAKFDVAIARSSDDFGEDFGFAEDFYFVAFQLDVGAGVFAVDHFVADGNRDAAALAAFEQLAGADGNDFAALRFFLGGVGQHDAAGGAFFGFDGFDDDTIIQRTNFRFWP